MLIVYGIDLIGHRLSDEPFPAMVCTQPHLVSRVCRRRILPCILLYYFTFRRVIYTASCAYTQMPGNSLGFALRESGH